MSTPHTRRRSARGARTTFAMAVLPLGLVAGMALSGCEQQQGQGVNFGVSGSVQPMPNRTSSEDFGNPQPPIQSAPSESTTSSGKPSSRPSNTDETPAPPNTPEPPETPAVERCHTSMLTASLRYEEAGAGSRYARMELRNTSSETCTLYGYGGMQLFGRQGQVVPTDMQRTNNPGPSLITLSPNEAAYSTLRWSAIPSDDEPTEACQPEPSTANVTPPDEEDSQTVQWKLGPVCNHGAIQASAYRQ